MFFLMERRTPKSTHTDTLFPCTTRFLPSGAHEATGIGGIGPLSRRRFGQIAETGIPAGIARPRAPARRAMQEAGALARHGVFVAAGDEEDRKSTRLNSSH